MPETPQFDILSNVLHSFRVNARICLRGSFCGKWALDSGGFKGSVFHLVGRGAAWLHAETLEQPIALRGGDLVMLPRGQWHQITGTPLREKHPTPQPKDASGPHTTMICGQVQSTAGFIDPIIRELPEILVVHADDQGTSAQLHALARMMVSEHESGGAGQLAVLERLAEVMFIMIIRHHLKSTDAKRGLLAAIVDERIAAVLGAVHAEPGKDWQVPELANLAGMSRTAFAQRFKSLLEMTPMQYVTQWRMHLAEDLLSDRRNSVTKIAEQLGYQTEAAFRRAFKRVSGVGPGKLRKEVTAAG